MRMSHVFPVVFALLVSVADVTPAFAANKCGQPVSTGAKPITSDCLHILKTSVGTKTCDPVCICDVDSAGGIKAVDALRCLRVAVGVAGISLQCPCPATCGPEGPLTNLLSGCDSRKVRYVANHPEGLETIDLTTTGTAVRAIYEFDYYATLAGKVSGNPTSTGFASSTTGPFFPTTSSTMYDYDFGPSGLFATARNSTTFDVVTVCHTTDECGDLPKAWSTCVDIDDGSYTVTGTLSSGGSVLTITSNIQDLFGLPGPYVFTYDSTFPTSCPPPQ